jgi:hypothetical protein
MHHLSHLHDLGAYGLGVGLAATCALCACVTNEGVDLGHNVAAGTPSASLDDASFTDDGGAALMSAAITATKGTVCAGECADLVATASGGRAPYSYAWGQGLGEGAGPKVVCPAATETYSVIVGSVNSEEQSTASATITVVACDAGAVAPPSRDAGQGAADAGATFCVPNPSFEGPTMVGTSGPPGVAPTAAPPQWQVCMGTPDVDPSVSLLPASDGKSYVGLAVGSMGPSSTEAIGTTLCEPLRAGAQYSFCLDLGLGVLGLMNPPGVLSPVLQIWAGGAPCSQDELLWTSPPITNNDSWKKVCGSFVPSQSRTNLVLVPAEGGATVGAGALSYVIVDDIVAGPVGGPRARACHICVKAAA